MEIRVKRWELMRHDARTGRQLKGAGPRTFWTLRGAVKEKDRLNASMLATKLPWRYSVSPR